MPNRILKESYITSPEIDQLTWFEECLWNRLIVKADDYGRLDGRPVVLKNTLFPTKDNVTLKTVDDAISRLSNIGLVSTYVVDNRPYIQLVTWERHQQIRAKKSKYPSPEEAVQNDDIICNQMISDDNKCPRNPIQYENPIRESNTNTDIEDFSCPYRPDPDDVREFIAAKGYHFSVEEFMDYYDAVDWMQNGNPIKNWMSKCSAFERNWKKDIKKSQNTAVSMPKYMTESHIPDNTPASEEMIERVRKLQEGMKQ